MSGPERPVYRVTITNVDQGWTETIQHRDALPEWDDVTVLLIDDFDMGWSVDGDQVPTKMAGDTCSFKMYARTATDVPAIEVGDVLLVDLDRPGPADTLIPYMHFAGRASDPTATTTPHHGIILTIAATGFLVDLSPDVDLGNDPSISYPYPEDRLAVLLPGEGGVSYARHVPRAFEGEVRTYGQMTAQDATDRLVAGAVGLSGDTVAVLRYAYDWYDFASAVPPGWTFINGDNEHLIFYLQEWLLTLPAPLTLIEDPDDPDMVVLGPDDTVVDQVTTLAASLCEAPADWAKSRADVVNVANVTYGANVGGVMQDAVSVVRDATSVARYGPAPRDIATFLRHSVDYLALGALYSNPAPGSLAWSVPSLVVLPDVMDDAELDQLAPTFYPHAEPVGSVAGRFIVLTDLDEDTAIAGTDRAMQLTGCAFNISRGKLRISLSVRPMPTPDFSTSITWAELAASGLGDTIWHHPITWEDMPPADAWEDLPPTVLWTSADSDDDWLATGGHYIDPALDWDELTYTDA